MNISFRKHWIIASAIVMFSSTVAICLTSEPKKPNGTYYELADGRQAIEMDNGQWYWHFYNRTNDTWEKGTPMIEDDDVYDSHPITFNQNKELIEK